MGNETKDNSIFAKCCTCVHIPIKVILSALIFLMLVSIKISIHYNKIIIYIIVI